jgi:hypothetical protein
VCPPSLNEILPATKKARREAGALIRLRLHPAERQNGHACENHAEQQKPDEVHPVLTGQAA